MASDTPNAMDHTPIAGVSIALNGDDRERVHRCGEELSTTGEVIMPLEDAPWGATFGMCADRFGVTWMINVGWPVGCGPPADVQAAIGENLPRLVQRAHVEVVW